MEDNAGAVSEGVAEAPFSELISRWLDEGDRLNEDVAVAGTVPASRIDGRLRQTLPRLRELADRYRLFVFAGVGLLPLALLVATQRVTPAPAIAASMVSLIPTAPTAAGPAPSPPWAIPAPPPPTRAFAATRVASVELPAHRPAKHRRRHHPAVRRSRHHPALRRSR